MKWQITVETFDPYGNFFDHFFEMDYSRAHCVEYAMEDAIQRHRANLIRTGSNHASKKMLPTWAIAVNVLRVEGIYESNFEQMYADYESESLELDRRMGWLTRPLNRF